MNALNTNNTFPAEFFINCDDLAMVSSALRKMPGLHSKRAATRMAAGDLAKCDLPYVGRALRARAAVLATRIIAGDDLRGRAADALADVRSALDDLAEWPERLEREIARAARQKVRHVTAEEMADIVCGPYDY